MNRSVPPSWLKVPLKRRSTAASLVLTMPVKVFGARGLVLVEVEVSDLKLGWSKVSGWGISSMFDDGADVARINTVGTAPEGKRYRLARCSELVVFQGGRAEGERVDSKETLLNLNRKGEGELQLCRDWSGAGENMHEM